MTQTRRDPPAVHRVRRTRGHLADEVALFLDEDDQEFLLKG